MLEGQAWTCYSNLNPTYQPFSDTGFFLSLLSSQKKKALKKQGTSVINEMKSWAVPLKTLESSANTWRKRTGDWSMAMAEGKLNGGLMPRLCKSLLDYDKVDPLEPFSTISGQLPRKNYRNCNKNFFDWTQLEFIDLQPN